MSSLDTRIQKEDLLQKGFTSEVYEKVMIVRNAIKEEGDWGISKVQFVKSFTLTGSEYNIETVIDKILLVLLHLGCVKITTKSVRGIEFDWIQYIE